MCNETLPPYRIDEGRGTCPFDRFQPTEISPHPLEPGVSHPEPDSPTPFDPRIILFTDEVAQVDHEIVHLDVAQAEPAVFLVFFPDLAPFAFMRASPWCA